MIMYEYYTENNRNLPMEESELNSLGRKGWELVTHSVEPDPLAYTLHHYVFKRVRRVQTSMDRISVSETGDFKTAW